MTTQTFNPLGNRVLIEPIAAEEKTAGGIFIPENAREQCDKGIVIKVGSGKKDEPMTVKVGDKVLFAHGAGMQIKIDGKDMLHMVEDNILAII